MPEVPIKQVSTFYGDFGGSSGLLFGNYWGLINLRGPWAGAPGPGFLSRGLWAGVSGPGPLGRGPWAEAPGPGLLGRSPWAEAPGPRQGDGGYEDCVKRCPKSNHELSRKGAESRDSSNHLRTLFSHFSRFDVSKKDMHGMHGSIPIQKDVLHPKKDVHGMHGSTLVYIYIYIGMFVHVCYPCIEILT